MTDCRGERHCALFIGETREASLRILRNGSTFSGVVNVYGEYVPVTGEMTPAGELVLTGRKAPATSGDREVEVTTLRVRLRDGFTTGALEYVVRIPPGPFVFGDVRHAGQITGAHRARSASGFDTTLFGGSWRGRFAVRDCSWVAWLWCYPHREVEVHSFELNLSQTGSQVVGTLTISPTVIAVSGAVTDGVLELRGQSSRVISGGSEEARLTAWSSRRDAVGNMTGTFAFELSWPGIGDGTRLYSTTYHAVEIVSTALSN
jgi:hypothetical protein